MADGSRNSLRTVWRALGSLWFAAVLLVLLLVAMAFATVHESTHGTPQALARFYYSTWFEVLLYLVGLNVLAALLLRFPFHKRQIGFVLTHLMILVTFAGALVTKYVGMNGQVGIVEGQTVDQLNAGRDMITVANRGDDSRSELDIEDAVYGRFGPTDITGGPVLELGDLRAEVVKFVPDSEWKRLVLNDNPTPAAAVEVALSPDGRDEPVWVFPGQPQRLGGVQVSYRLVTSSEELTELLQPGSSSPDQSKGTVRIVYQDKTYEFPMEEALHGGKPIGDTGYTARVLRYIPRATVGDGGVINAPDRPMNPYIEVELSGPDGTETRQAFAKFPDFGSMHGDTPAADLKLTFVASANAGPAAATPIEVLSGPGDQLHVRFSGPRDTFVTYKLGLNDPVDSLWPGQKFTVLQRYDQARVDWALEPVEPMRKTNTPAALLKFTHGENTSELWVQKYQRRPTTIEGVMYDVTYADKTIPLDFAITLNKFHLGYYPGGRRPRSFESHVTIADPTTGRTMDRVISMNHPLEYGGYTFYQSSYRQDRNQTISFLSVAKDPGQIIVFVGYIGLMAGMVVVLGIRMSERRRKTAPAAT